MLIWLGRGCEQGSSIVPSGTVLLIPSCPRLQAPTAERKFVQWLNCMACIDG
ncbi:hypothetical protein GGQ85_004086 [Nitrobacter vulgaris]|nr:hypothetical protein [Nitrobacter vulgaris]